MSRTTFRELVQFEHGKVAHKASFYRDRMPEALEHVVYSEGCSHSGYGRIAPDDVPLCRHCFPTLGPKRLDAKWWREHGGHEAVWEES